MKGKVILICESIEKKFQFLNLLFKMKNVKLIPSNSKKWRKYEIDEIKVWDYIEYEEKDKKSEKILNDIEEIYKQDDIIWQILEKEEEQIIKLKKNNLILPYIYINEVEVEKLFSRTLEFLGAPNSNSRKEKRVLSIDGGGIRGIYAVEVIKTLEKHLGMKLADYFDYFVGVSAGSLIATLLTAGLSGYEIERTYYQYKDDIFKEEDSNSIDDLYNAINSIIFTYGDRIIKNTANGKKLCILYYRTSALEGEVYEFNGRDKDELIQKVVSSCSAPHYFDIDIVNKNPDIDGGFVTRNPSLIGLSRVLKDEKSIQIENIKLLSIGCLQAKVMQDFIKLKFFEVPLGTFPAKVLSPFLMYKKCIEFALEGMTNFAHKQLVDIFARKEHNYLRIDEKVDEDLELTKENSILIKKVQDFEMNFNLKFKDRVDKFFENN